MNKWFEYYNKRFFFYYWNAYEDIESPTFVEKKYLVIGFNNKMLSYEYIEFDGHSEHSVTILGINFGKGCTWEILK